MQIVGHEKQREELEESVAPAVLLLGPSGVGKWLVARSHADGAAMTLRDGPTVDQAREMASLFQQRPIRGGSTVCLVDLDRCSEAVQNVLLKTVEELPTWGKIVFVASKLPRPTILSRCQVIRFKPLHDHEVADALELQGRPKAEAEFMALMAGGSVERALEFAVTSAAKPVVMSYLDAVARVDRVALSSLMPRWDADAGKFLWRWITEVLTDWPRVFTKSELSVVHKMGVEKFYKLVECIRSHMSPDLAAMQVWKIR